MNIKSFLKKQIEVSLEALVKGLAKSKSGKPFDGKEANAISAVIKTMRGMDLTEELRFFLLFLVAKCGENGTAVEWVEEVAGGEIKNEPAKKSTVTVEVKASAPAEVVPASAPTPIVIRKEQVTTITTSVAKTAPARTLSVFESWSRAIKVYITAGKVDFKELQGLTARMFGECHQLSNESWRDLFIAMKKAASVGRFIVGKDANPYRVFSLSPVSMLDDYIFGQDGVLALVTAEVADHVGVMPPWMVAKSAITLDALRSLQENLRSKASMGFDEHSQDRVVKFVVTLEQKNAPKGILETAHRLIGVAVADTLEKVQKESHVSNPAMLEAFASAGVVELPAENSASSRVTEKTQRRKARKALIREQKNNHSLPAEKFSAEVPSVVAAAVVEEVAEAKDHAVLDENGGKPGWSAEEQAEFNALMAAEEEKNNSSALVNGAPAVPVLVAVISEVPSETATTAVV